MSAEFRPSTIDSDMGSNCDQPSGQSAPQLSSDPSPSGGRLLRNVLIPALQFWLRSQAEQVETLHLDIQGGDRQIMSGYIPQVAIAATSVIYQGLHLSELAVQGRNIRINLGQVVRGKPLKLLEIVPVEAQLQVSEADLNTSLATPLLADAIRDVLTTLGRSPADPNLAATIDPPATSWKTLFGSSQQIYPVGIRLKSNGMTLIVELEREARLPTGDRQPERFTVILNMGLVAAGQTLKVIDPTIQTESKSDATPLPQLTIPLGTDVNLTELRLEPGQLSCQGHINILP